MLRIVTQSVINDGSLEIIEKSDQKTQINNITPSIFHLKMLINLIFFSLTKLCVI